MGSDSTPSASNRGAQVAAALEAIYAVIDVIRETGPIPSGHLYATMMGAIDIHTYNAIIDIAIKSGRVRRDNHMLSWVPPAEPGEGRV
jgi:hypothetical protein